MAGSDLESPRVEPRPRLREIHVALILGVVALLLAAAFASLGSEVLEGETRRFDLFMLRLAQSMRAGNPQFVGALRDLSALGSATVLSVFVTITAGYLVLRSQRRNAALLVASAISGALLVSVLKDVFGRSRPPAIFAELVAPGLSFPSGHSAQAAMVYLMIGAWLARTRSSRNERLYILASTALLAFLVGLTRVALGVHWATDVLGGWAFGTAWAIGSLLCVRLLTSERASGNPAAIGQGTRFEREDT